MKTIWKILIAIGALWFIGSAMTAAPSTPDMENLNIPGVWDYMGDGNYVDQLHGGHVLVKNASEYTSLDDFITNDTAEGYSVSDCSGNGTMYSYTWDLDYDYEFGVFEVVCVNGTDYIIFHDYSAEDWDSYMNSGDVYDEELLKQMNELNNLEPVQI